MADLRREREALLSTLEHERRPEVRSEAAEALCELAMESPAAMKGEFSEVVVRLLGDVQDDVRCAGLALAAEALPSKEAEDVLVRHVGDRVPRVRLEAVGRLADLALPDARGALASALEDELLAVRFEAARGMAALKHSAGLEVLLDAVEDPALCFRAAAALARLGDRSAIPRLKKAFSSWFLPQFERTQLAGALAALGEPEGIAHLFKRAKKRWSVDRAMALELLGEVRAAGARARLLEILKDPADPSRGAAARGLGRLEDSSVEPDLVAVLDERLVADDIKLDVAEGLLALGTASARAHVRSLRFEEPGARAELLAMLEETAADAGSEEVIAR
jgi:HEAT repeat protein